MEPLVIDGTTASSRDWLRDLVEHPLPGSADLIEEYDVRFRADPLIWTSGEHDRFVHDLLTEFCRCSGRALAGRLLDIGCGNGHTLAHFSQRAGADLALAGLDFSPVGLELARERLPEAELRCCDFLAEAVPGDRDFILSLGVFEHLEDPRPALRKAVSLLAPGGVMYLDVPNGLWRGWSGRHEGFRRHASGSEQIEWHLRRASWKRLLGEAGVGVVAAIQGPVPWLEFVWLLSADPGVARLDSAEFWRHCARERARAAPTRRRHWLNLQKARVKRWLGRR